MVKPFKKKLVESPRVHAHLTSAGEPDMPQFKTRANIHLDMNPWEVHNSLTHSATDGPRIRAPGFGDVADFFL